MKATFENENTKAKGEASVTQRIVLSFGNGEYSKPFDTTNPDKAVRVYNAKEYFEVQ